MDDNFVAEKLRQSRNPELLELVVKLQSLHKSHTNTEMSRIIYNLDLPLNIHLFVTWKFTELMDLTIKIRD